VLRPPLSVTPFLIHFSSLRDARCLFNLAIPCRLPKPPDSMLYSVEPLFQPHFHRGRPTFDCVPGLSFGGIVLSSIFRTISPPSSCFALSPKIGVYKLNFRFLLSFRFLILSQTLNILQSLALLSSPIYIYTFPTKLWVFDWILERFVPSVAPVRAPYLFCVLYEKLKTVSFYFSGGPPWSFTKIPFGERPPQSPISSLHQHIVSSNPSYL